MSKDERIRPASQDGGVFRSASMLRLADAARECFRPGDMTVSGLRLERDRGNLVVFRIAGKDFTTKDEIAAMVERCRYSALRSKPSALSPSPSPLDSDEVAFRAVMQRVEKIRGLYGAGKQLEVPDATNRRRSRS